MNIYEILLVIGLVAIAGFFVYLGAKIRELTLSAAGVVISFGLYAVIASHSSNRTPVYPVFVRDAKVLSKIETDRFYSYYYEADDGSYKEAKFESIEDFNKIKSGGTLKIVYYFGKTTIGSDKSEVRTEIR